MSRRVPQQANVAAAVAGGLQLCPAGIAGPNQDDRFQTVDRDGVQFRQGHFGQPVGVRSAEGQEQPPRQRGTSRWGRGAPGTRGGETCMSVPSSNRVFGSR